MSERTVSSNPLLRRTLILSAGASAILLVVGSTIGYLVSGPSGLWSALIAVLLAALFLGLTAASILIANRWFGDPLYIPIFFGSVMGAWILKFILLIVALVVLRGQPWLNPTVFLVALIVSVVVSLVIDVLVMLTMRIPHVSDVTLPTEVPEDAANGGPPQA